MREYKTAILTAIFAVAATCATAQVTFNPTGGNKSLLSYTFDDVSSPYNPTSGDGANAQDLFSAQGGTGSFTVEGRGYAGYDSTTASEASTNDFGSYLTTLTNVNLSANGGDKWGVDSSSHQSDSNNNRLTGDEAMIFTFVTTNLSANTTLSLESITWANGGNTEKVDVYIYDPVSNVVVSAAVGVGTKNSRTFSIGVKNGYQLVIGNAIASNDLTLNFMTLDIDAPIPDYLVPPFFLGATANNTRVSLNWIASENQDLLDHYEVYRSTTTSAATFNSIGTSLSSDYQDDTATNGTTFYYMIKAVDTNGVETAFGNRVSATPSIRVPTGLRTKAANGQVRLNWSASTDRLFDSVNVYRSTVPGSYDTSSPLTNVTLTTYTDTGITNGGIYYYAISTVDANGGESALSSEVMAKPNSGVFIDFNSSGSQQGGESTITLSDLGNDPVTYSYSASIFGGAGLTSGSQDYFTKSTATGYIVIRGRPYTDSDPNDIDNRYRFGPDTWTGNNLIGTFDVTPGGFFTGNRNGVGVADSTGHGFCGTGEAILLQFDLSNLHLAPGTCLVLKDAGHTPVHLDNPYGIYLRDFSVPTGVSGAGVLVGSETKHISEVVLHDGYTFAMAGSFVLTSLMLDIVPTKTLYDTWASNWGVDVGAAYNDYDLDGLANLSEYALGGNPTNGAVAGATLPTFTQSGSSFRYVIPKRSDDESLIYIVETTDDLVGGTWTNEGYIATGTNVTGGTLNFITNEVDTVDAQKYIRLQIMQ